MTSPRILIVEDDDTIGRNLGAALHREGYDVELVQTARGAIAAAEQRAPAIVLLDLGLPDRDGLDVCQALRARDSSIRIIILTARREEVDVVIGLDAGADDYVRKPFSLSELLARIRVQLRISAHDAAQPVFEAGDLTIDTASRRAFHARDEVELSRKEFDLLALLASNRGIAVEREQIMDEVWGGPWYGSTKTLDMHISNLRKKLSGSSVRIVTLRHVGYRLDP